MLVSGSWTVWEEVGTEEIEVEGLRLLRLHRDDDFNDLHAKAYHPGVDRVLRETLASEQPDIVHLHHWLRLTSNIVEICDDMNIPVIVTIHDLYVSCPRCFRVRRDGENCSRHLSVESCVDCVPRYGHESQIEIEEGIRLHRENYLNELGLARGVFFSTAATRDAVCEWTGFPEDRTRILSMGYQRRFAESAPPLSPGEGEPFRFAYWGVVTQRKGVQGALRALRQAAAKEPSQKVELHVFGWIDTEDLDRELRDLASGMSVTFHGKYDYEQLRGAGIHMGVFPMLCFETFGFVLDECFELGLPCLITNIGAMPARAGEAAIAVPPGDVEALAEAMARILARPEICEELARKIPALPPLPDEHCASLLEIYDQAIASSRPDPLHPSIDPQRRTDFLLLQRESAQQTLNPGKGPS